MVTRTLNMKHPFLDAILNIYALRPVPGSSDSRTKEQRDSVNDADLISVWLGTIDPRNMFPAARELYDLNFDAKGEAAKILDRHLELGFMGQNKTSQASSMLYLKGLTSSFRSIDNRKIRVTLFADMVWPLLVPEYTQAEKAASSCAIVATLLHELAHAHRAAVMTLICYRRDAAGNPYPPVIDQALRSLAQQTGSTAPAPGNPNDMFNNPWFFQGKKTIEL